MHLLKCLVIVGIFGLMSGCGGDGAVKVEQKQAAPADAIKAGLQDVVNSGEVGSGAETIEQEIEKLRETDAAKADELKADFDKLMSAGSPAKIKEQAQAMIDKL